MKILVTICARGGSKGVPNKNIRPLLGKPLIAYSIEQAQRWGRADRIIVSTDSEDIARVAKEFGAEVPFLRPSALATDTAEKLPVLRHALTIAEEIHGRFDVLVDLDACSPLRTVEDLENCRHLFLEKRPKTLFSAVVAHKNPYFNMVEVDPSGWAHLCKKLPLDKRGVTRRQDAPAVYNMNASIYFYQRDVVADESLRTCFTDRSLVYEMNEFTAFDIDREIDFKLVEFILKEGLFHIT